MSQNQHKRETSNPVKTCSHKTSSCTNQCLSLGHFPPIEIHWKTKLLPWHSINSLQLRHAIEGLRIFQERMTKVLSPTRFLWQKILSKQCDDIALERTFCKFWILHSYYMWDTKTKHLLMRIALDSKLSQTGVE